MRKSAGFMVFGFCVTELFFMALMLSTRGIVDPLTRTATATFFILATVIMMSRPELDHDHDTKRNGFIAINATMLLALAVSPMFSPVIAALFLVFELTFLIVKIPAEDRLLMVRTVLTQYIDPKIVNANLARTEGVRVGGDRRKLAILFADLSDFTSYCSVSSGADVATMLNRYFSYCQTAIHANHGTIDKFMGDSAMAFFGDPGSLDEPCLHAARAAIRIQQLCDRFARDLNFHGVSIGLSYGEVLVGNFGCIDHLEYTVLGHEVNVAARLQKIAGKGRIVVSGGFHDEVKDEFRFQPMIDVALKGLPDKQRAYVLEWSDSK